MDIQRRPRRRVRCAGVVLATTATLAASAVIAPPAWAAKPRNHACVGEFMSGQATTTQPPAQGQNMSNLARFGGPLPSSLGPGAGDSIQNLQAGLVPDTAQGGINNPCND